MTEQPRKTPLVELLRSVPRDAVWVFNDVMSMSSYPVGKWCHEAAAEITGHEAAKFACMRDNEALREKLGRLLGFILGWTKDVGLPQLKSWDEAIGDAEQHIYDLRGALRAESDIAAQAMQERDALIADYRDEFSCLCHTLSVGSEGRPEMTASDWRKRVDEGISMLVSPLQNMIAERDARIAELEKSIEGDLGWRAAEQRWRLRAERAESELARLRGQEPLFLLTTGAIDSDGEQDDWDIECDSSRRLDAFCAAHPGMTVKLYAEPMPAKEAK
jgi:hypothetical protein